MKKAYQSGCSVWARIRGFAATVRSPPPVRTAFTGHLTLRWWWRLVLLLHGKPCGDAVWGSKEWTSVADGFRFYGYLYRFLSAIMGLAAGWAWACEILDCYWVSLMVTAASGLWCITGLALAGADL